MGQHTVVDYKGSLRTLPTNIQLGSSLILRSLHWGDCTPHTCSIIFHSAIYLSAVCKCLFTNSCSGHRKSLSSHQRYAIRPHTGSYDLYPTLSQGVALATHTVFSDDPRTMSFEHRRNRRGPNAAKRRPGWRADPSCLLPVQRPSAPDRMKHVQNEQPDAAVPQVSINSSGTFEHYGKFSKAIKGTTPVFGVYCGPASLNGLPVKQ